MKQGIQLPINDTNNFYQLLLFYLLMHVLVCYETRPFRPRGKIARDGGCREENEPLRAGERKHKAHEPTVEFRKLTKRNRHVSISLIIFLVIPVRISSFFL